MKKFLIVLLILLVIPISSAIITESENFKINFVVKPAVEPGTKAPDFVTFAPNQTSGEGYLLLPELQVGYVSKEINVSDTEEKIEPAPIDTSCSIIRLGNCVFPNNPFIGWILVITSVFGVIKYMGRERDEKVYK